ncbi:MAG: GspMb/PilO family protein [Pseudomonadota bacterium]
MTVKEKKLINIMLLIVFLGIMFKGAPFAYTMYQQGKNDIIDFKDKRERIRQLMFRQEFWQAEYDKSLKQNEILSKELFTANSNELVAAKVQSVIKNLAKQSGVRIDSMHLAEFRQSGEWLLVSLSISINAQSSNLVDLLQKLKSNQQKLLIKGVRLRSYSNSLNGALRKSLNGTITVVGFSRSTTTSSDEKEAG